MTSNKHLVRGYLAAVATLLMWSGFSLFSRLAGKSVLTPYDVYALRLITASLFLLPFAKRLPRGAWKDGRLWLLTCLCSLIYCPLAYNGFKYAPAAHGGILLAGLQPLLIGLIVWVTTGTRPGRLRLGGLVLITSGVACAAVPHFISWSPDIAFGDLLILLSDIDGLYDSDPHRNPDARLIETVPVIDAHILSLAGDKGSALATGGMVTKLHAAQIATAAGCEMVIANGEKPEVLYDIVAGRRAGTRFLIPHS